MNPAGYWQYVAQEHQVMALYHHDYSVDRFLALFFLARNCLQTKLSSAIKPIAIHENCEEETILLKFIHRNEKSTQ
jgi:hypothetical protein